MRLEIQIVWEHTAIILRVAQHTVAFISDSVSSRRDTFAKFITHNSVYLIGIHVYSMSQI
jgi:hypothetical protein